MTEIKRIRIGGFGGQGVILASVVLGTAAAIYDGKDAVQTQSYGQQARGGECKAEVIISDTVIVYPIVEEVDIFIAMSRPAIKQYLKDLNPGGCLIFDPDVINIKPDRSDIDILEIPATTTASRLGNKIAANMVMLGALTEKTRVVSYKALDNAVRDTVPSRFLELNLKAIEEGKTLVKAKS